MKDVFLFDLDETLVDFSRAEETNFFKTLGGFGIAADGALYARFHAINDGLWKLLERGGISREELKIRRFEQLFGECGIAADGAAVAAAYFGNFEEICFPYRGAQELLRKLAARGRIYLVTNGGARIQRSHVRLAGFEPFLSGVFISEEIGSDKPMPAFARYVESHIENYARERAVWVGDSLTSDMVCAKSVGIDFILYAAKGIPQGFKDPAADNYDELYEMLTAM